MSDPTPADLVVELLRTLDEAASDFVPWTDGGGVRMMPSTYRDGSYAELEYRLGEMRERHRREWWHLSARYLWGGVGVRLVPTRKTVKGRTPVTPARSELLIAGEIRWPGGLQLVKLYTWGEDVDERLVELGIGYLVATMYDGDTSSLTLPDPFLKRLLGERSGHVAPVKSNLPHSPLVAP